MDISTLPPELIVSLAEHLDAISLARLTCTNKRIRCLIQAYEHSICMTKFCDLAVFQDGDRRITDGHVLTSASIKRKACKTLTVPGIHELELRKHRFDEIVNGGFVDLATPPGMGPLTPVQQRRFIHILRRALYHCDAVADVAANIGAPLPDYDYTHVSGGIWSLASGLGLETQDHDPFANIHARTAQIRYLESLSVEDLAGLYVSIMAFSSGHIRDRPALQADPNFAERITVFEECTLRHGTWFLWAQAFESKAMLRETTGHMLLAGFAELIGWETGDEHVAPGLRMSLLEAAKCHFVKIDEHPVVYHLYQVVRKQVFGNEMKKAT